jgi:hypothetical protein
MVDVGDDAEVPNLRRRGEGLVGETTDGNLLVDGRPSGGCLGALSCLQGIEAASSEHNRAEPSYAANMASQWRTLQRFQRNLENLVFNEAPKLIRQLQQSPTVQRGIKIGLDVIVGTASEPPSEITAGRPVTSISAPTAHRARRLVYSPDLDGRADPGEIVWTWVTYEDDPTRGKDRPVLVVGRDQHTLLGLMMSSQERHAADRDWVEIGSGSWDGDGRPSWVRLDRVLDVPEEGIRREGAIVERAIFDVVAARLRSEYSWS